MIDNIHDVMMSEQALKAIAFDTLIGMGTPSMEKAYAMADFICHICKEDQERVESFGSLLGDDDVIYKINEDFDPKKFHSFDPEE